MTIQTTVKEHNYCNYVRCRYIFLSNRIQLSLRVWLNRCNEKDM